MDKREDLQLTPDRYDSESTTIEDSQPYQNEDIPFVFDSQRSNNQVEVIEQGAGITSIPEKKDGSAHEASQIERYGETHSLPTTGLDREFPSAPHWANQLYEKLTDLEGRLDGLSYQVCVIESNELKAASHFRKLDGEVNAFKTARDGIKDDISTLQRAKDEILEYLDEELERLKNVPVSLHLAFNRPE
ncbi:MAG: hypothetical protein M1813_002611 [Trichoglossum hirsutum]|nr:MAG: hypothetical protein M1813_002611 [Trichoglossum hirsutum]